MGYFDLDQSQTGIETVKSTAGIFYLLIHETPGVYKTELIEYV